MIKNKNLIAIIFIIVFTFMASYPAVFDYKSMYLDDMHRYDLAIRNKMHPTIIKRNYVRAYVMYFAYELMTIDLALARGFLLLLMILSSITLYFLFYKYMGFTALSSFIISVMPNIMPNIIKIPSFVDGSYTVPGQFVSFWVIITGIIFIKREGFKWNWFLLSGPLYILSFEMMDQAMFMLIPIALIVSYTSKRVFSAKNIWLVLMYFLIFARELLVYFFSKQASPTSMRFIPFDQIIYRIKESLKYSMPLNFDEGKLSVFMSILSFVILGFGFLYLIFIIFKSNNKIKIFFDKRNKYKQKHVFLILLGVAWFISISIIFWASSPYFSNRYFHLPAFGLSMLFAFSFESALSINNFKKLYKWIIYLVLSLLLISTSFIKFKILKNKFNIENRAYYLLKKRLSNKEFPENSQIIIAGNLDIPTSGYWIYSSGYLRFLTKRVDISGVLSYPKLQFYDPFRIDDRGFQMHMSGLALKKPIFIFRVDKDKINQYKYALRWKAARWTKDRPGSTRLGQTHSKKLKNSDWEILKFNQQNGSHIIYKKGKGLNQYNAFLKSKEIKKIGISKILFNGPMSLATKKRFGIK